MLIFENNFLLSLKAFRAAHISHTLFPYRHDGLAGSFAILNNAAYIPVLFVLFKHKLIAGICNDDSVIIPTDMLSKDLL